MKSVTAALTERLFTFGLLTLLVGICYSLKFHYSHANPAELRWILTPTGALVELLSGHPFAFEAGIGLVSGSAQLAITKACAGVNFLIVCVASLAGMGVVRLRLVWHKAAWLGCSLLLSYLVTVLVNSVRILIALELHREHLIEGTVVYLVALCVSCAGAGRRLDRFLESSPEKECLSTGSRCGWGAHVWPALLPLGLYLSVTVAVPAVNGAYHSQAYWRHSLLVLLTTAAVGGLWGCIFRAVPRTILAWRRHLRKPRHQCRANYRSHSAQRQAAASAVRSTAT